MMPRSPEHEWDWPPRQQRRLTVERMDGEDDGPVIEARVIRERVEFVQPPRRTGWSSPTVTKIVRWYVAIVITIVKVLIAVPLTIMLLGSLWLLWTIVTLPKP